MQKNKAYRQYTRCNKQVEQCYQKQRIRQNYTFARRMQHKYCTFEKKAAFWDLFDSLSKFVDVSDPDIHLPNASHLFQTAESIRKAGLPEWFQIVGLIHDLGKILYLKGNDMDGTSIREQWAIVGDTFITGCPLPDTIIFPEFNDLNADHSKFSDPWGIYGKDSKGIGLNNVQCSFGHDEYLYHLLRFNRVRLPEEAYYIIRYHSLYLWHDKDEYAHFENEKDRKMKPWVKRFNQFDLYTKTDKDPGDNWKAARKYYASIIHKYIPRNLYY